MKKIIFSLLIGISLFFLTPPIEAKEESHIQEEIIYNILVDRFNNGDPTQGEQVDIEDPYAYHGGDLQGIIMKLDHIKKLGFTTISLSSILENAPKGFHGYWVENHYEIEEQFGAMDNLKELIKEAHSRDIKVILELNTNYVAPSHPFVNEQDKADWFMDNTLTANESTTWLDDVLVLNQANEDVQNYLIDVAEFWMTETDIDGFKLHAADQSYGPFLMTLAEHIKNVDPEFYLIANVLDVDDENMEHLSENQYIDATENTSMFKTMNQVFTQVENPVNVLYDDWDMNEEQSNILFVDNQNTARFTYNFGVNNRNDFTAWKLVLTYMYMTPGIPSIYQGSELAMSGEGFPYNQYLVLFNSSNPEIEEFYEKISALRSEFLPVITYGDFELVDTSGAMSLFKRTYEDESIYIAINNDSVSRVVTLTGIDSDVQLRGLLGDNLVRENENGEFKVGIERESAEVYIIEENEGINWAFIGFVVGVVLLFIIGVNYLSYKQRKREKAQQ